MKKLLRSEQERIVGEYVRFDENMNSIFKDGDGYKIMLARRKILMDSYRRCIKAALEANKFTKAELNQLLSYVEFRDNGPNAGWYSGNKQHFEKRHKSIIQKIQDILNNL